MKTVYMIPQVVYTAGIIHVILCQMKTVYMVPPVQCTAVIIHVNLCQ